MTVSIRNCQKLIEGTDRKAEGYSRPEKHHETTIFTQQEDTNSIQVPIDYKLEDTGTYPGP